MMGAVSHPFAVDSLHLFVLLLRIQGLLFPKLGLTILSSFLLPKPTRSFSPQLGWFLFILFIFYGLDRWSWGNSRDWVFELRDGRQVVIPLSLY